MGRKQTNELSDKDLKALSLFEEGMSFKEIAGKIGCSSQYLYGMSVGETGVYGSKATLFKEAAQSIRDKKEEAIAELTRENRKLSMSVIKDILREYEGKKLQDKDKKMVSLLTNSIAKLQPNVKIGNMSVSYVSNFTLEELAHEYGRLRAASDGPTDSRRVQEDESEGPGEVHSPVEPGSAAEEIPEDPRL
jgi:transposase